MGEVLVEYDYKARSSDELTIKKGDIIKDVINVCYGWSEGVLNDKRGMFPDNYVKSLDKDVIFRNKRDTNSSLRQCKVIFSYQPVHPDELTLNTDDIIEIIGEDEEGWWRGVYNGKEGVFPSNFVEEIFPAKPKRQEVNNRDELPNILSDARIPNLPPKPAKIYCEVKYMYKAQNDDELNLKEGDIVTLINKDLADPGWWEGELNGKIGVFPDNFVTIIKSKEETKPTNDIPETTSINNKPTAIVSQRNSLEIKVDETKATPPLIHKKPMLPKKKSPSSTSKGFLSSIVNRKSDSVDGLAGSKSYHLKNDVKVEVKKENGEKALDEVERNPLLKDVRAGRAKPPVRRPPTSGVVKDKHSTEAENAIVASSEDEATPETKPPVREWEKHKAPWLEEMKMNQAKRSSTSPVSEKNLNTKGIYPELDRSPIESSLMSKSMPCPELLKTSPNDLTNSIENEETKKIANSKFNSENIFRKQPIPKAATPVINSNAITANSTIPTATTTTSNLNKHQPQQQQHKNTPNNNNEKINEKLDDRGCGDFAQDLQDERIQLTVSQYNSILDRIQRLENLVEKQALALENMKAKFVDKQKRFDDSNVL